METLKQYLYKNHSDQTAKRYLYEIEIFLMQHPKAETYLYGDIIGYIHQLKKINTGIRTVSGKLIAIKRYYDYLLQSGIRNDHPCKNIRLKIKKSPIQIQDLFTTMELEALMNRENRYPDLELRNKVIISLLINQALTATELCRLELKDIDLEEGTLHIKGSNKNEERILNLKPNQIILVQRYMDTSRRNLLKKENNRLIITWRGSIETVDGVHSVIEQLKALYPDRILNPATIRQSVIANLLNEKKIPIEDVQLFAGHKWPSTTERYKRTDINEQREKINMWHPLR